MCLIIRKSANVTVPEELLVDAYEYNKDGWGLMYATEGKIEVLKGLKITELLDAILLLKYHEVFIHLRYRTHGAVNYDNLHPFKISDDLWLMHNGVLNQLPTHKVKSDTALFTQMLMPMLANNPSLLDDQGFLNLITHYCKGSRVVFLRSSGESTIINQQDGIEWSNLWCSNTYAWSLWDTKPKMKAKTKALASTVKDSFKIDPKLWQGDDYVPDWNTDLTLDEDEPTSLQDWSLDELRKLSYDDLYNLTWEDPDALIYAIMYG